MVNLNPSIVDLDADQITRREHDATSDAQRVRQISGALITEIFDFMDITYITVGNGLNQPGTIVYKNGGSGGTIAATITITYDSNNNPLTVTKT